MVVAGGIYQAVQSSFRYVADFGQRQTKMVVGDGQGFAVEIASAKSKGCAILLEENQWIIGDAV